MSLEGLASAEVTILWTTISVRLRHRRTFRDGVLISVAATGNPRTKYGGCEKLPRFITGGWGGHSIYRWWISLKCSFQVPWSRSKCFNGRTQRNNSSRGFGPLGNMRVKLIQRKYIVFWSSKITSNIPQINMMSKFAFCLASAGKCVVYEYIICVYTNMYKYR